MGVMMRQNGSLKHIGNPPSWIFDIKFFNSRCTLDMFRIILPTLVEVDDVEEISQFFVFFYSQDR